MGRVALVALLAACGHSADHAMDASVTPHVVAARAGITADQVGVLINHDDPLSVSVAEYYMAARGIPAANFVHLHVPAGTSITAAQFAPLADQVTAAFAGMDIQALAITWTQPYAVDNMSITSAFSLGVKTIGDTCNDPASQAANPYLGNPASTAPFTDLAFRPAMTIPAVTLDDAKALIDRGVASDDTWPTGTAYLMDTSDQIRSARCIVNPMYGYTNECQALIDSWGAADIPASIVMADSVSGKSDVLFYVQGLASVPDLATNTYPPGAIADHLTSFGGQIPTSGQMSAFEFLRAGATGSYGTVVEPCAFQEKFPNPAVLVPDYFMGGTLIEAYWKSVVWPAEGIFIGEPLARPFGNGVHSTYADDVLTIETTTMIPNRPYMIEAADADVFTPVQTDLMVPTYQKATFTVEHPDHSLYRLSPMP